MTANPLELLAATLILIALEDCPCAFLVLFPTLGSPGPFAPGSDPAPLGLAAVLLFCGSPPPGCGIPIFPGLTFSLGPGLTPG